jgi:MFS family permease
VLSDGPFLTLLVLHLLFLVVFTQFLAAAPVDMASHGLGPAEFGRVLAVNGFLIALLQPFTARLVGRRDPARALAVGAVLVGLGYGGYGLATTPWQYAGASAVWTLGEMLTFPTATAVVAGLSPADLRGRYQGLLSLTFGLAMILSPALGSLVLSRLGPGVLWSGCLAVALLVAAGHLAAGPARRRRLAASRTV